MSNSQFIEQIAAYVAKYASKYNICVHSAIIAQSILESASGTSELAQNANNFFGLKWRENRCQTSNGYYIKVGSEQNADGSYTSSAMKWFRFPNMEAGVQGYFDFINNANYSKLKGVTDPRIYLENIKAAGYATSLKYVENLMNVIQKYDLTKYDPIIGENTEVLTMKKVFLSAGHGGSNPGAVANGLKEKDINLQTLLACKEVLEKHNIEVICSRVIDENDPVQDEVKEANNSNCDLAVSFHANAGGGDGFEAFCNLKNANAVNVAKLAEKHIKALGQNSRGIKGGMRLYFVKNTKMDAVLFESFFLDNANDYKIGDTVEEQKKFGVAYAKAILEHFNIPYIEDAAEEKIEKEEIKQPSGVPYLVRVTASALNVRIGAGLHYKIKTDVKKNEVFTIVEEKNGWGKLKSGAGWIKLIYTEKV